MANVWSTSPITCYNQNQSMGSEKIVCYGEDIHSFDRKLYNGMKNKIVYNSH